MSIMSRIRRTALIAAAGAASAYFLDPAEGEARRRAVSDRARGLLRMASEPADLDLTRTVGGPDPAVTTASGAAAEGGGDRPSMQERTGDLGDDEVVVPAAPAPELADGLGRGGAPLPPPIAR